jgi:hypothetical protein
MALWLSTGRVLPSPLPWFEGHVIGIHLSFVYFNSVTVQNDMWGILGMVFTLSQDFLLLEIVFGAESTQLSGVFMAMQRTIIIVWNSYELSVNKGIMGHDAILMSKVFILARTRAGSLLHCPTLLQEGLSCASWIIDTTPVMMHVR